MDESLAKELLEKTKKDYDLIAEEYSAARPSAWQELVVFTKWVKDGDFVLDIGCGNGRLLDLLADKKIDYLGVDNCQKLLDLARQRHPQNKFLLADALNLCLGDNLFDVAFAVAVLHHIPSKAYRRRFFQEAKRVLKPGGYLILTVWNLFRPQTLLPLFRYTLLRILGLSRFDFGDLFLPWGRKTERYYHYFTRKELKELAKESGLRIMEIDNVQGVAEGKRSNLCLVCQKPSPLSNG